MYKDKDKQKKAAKERARRYRERQKGVTDVTPRVTPKAESVTPEVIPVVTPNLPANFGQPDCQCKHCQNTRASGSKFILNHGPYKRASELAGNELNRVSLPGDVDYQRKVG